MKLNKLTVKTVRSGRNNGHERNRIIGTVIFVIITIFTIFSDSVSFKNLSMSVGLG